MRSISAIAFLMTSLGSVPSGSHAAGFDVAPVRLEIQGQDRIALLHVNNRSDAPLRLQATAVAWSQSASGEMTLVPTQEVTCFPSLFEIGPGESRSIRVGVPLSGGDMERAFRVLIQELPASDPLKGLKVITRLSVPVFVAPVTAQPATIALEGVSQQEGRVSLRVRNSSNLHLLAQSATIRGRDEAGALLFERVMPAWYILAGEARTFDTEVPPEAARAVALEVQLETDRGAVGTSAVLKSP